MLHWTETNWQTLNDVLWNIAEYIKHSWMKNHLNLWSFDAFCSLSVLSTGFILLRNSSFSSVRLGLSICVYSWDHAARQPEHKLVNPFAAGCWFRHYKMMQNKNWNVTETHVQALIWENSVRVFLWIPTWQGLEGLRNSSFLLVLLVWFEYMCIFMRPARQTEHKLVNNFWEEPTSRWWCRAVHRKSPKGLW